MVNAMSITLGIFLTLVTTPTVIGESTCGDDDDCPGQICYETSCIDCWNNDDCPKNYQCRDAGAGYLCVVPQTRVGFNFVDLGACEGDCDTDSDCAGDLICFQRTDAQHTRFCENVATGYDLCIPTPSLMIDNSGWLCTGSISGDCVGCEDGLHCLLRAVGDPVPGCRGVPYQEAAYCIQGENVPTPAPTPSPTPAPTPACHDFTSRDECHGPYCVWWKETCQAADSWCVNGILDGKDCCHSACGACGGENCAQLPGGASKCCPHRFKRACTSGEDTACVIEGPHDKAYCEDDESWEGMFDGSPMKCGWVKSFPESCTYDETDKDGIQHARRLISDLTGLFNIQVRLHCPKSCGLCQAECVDSDNGGLDKLFAAGDFAFSGLVAFSEGEKLGPQIPDIRSCEDLSAHKTYCQAKQYNGEPQYIMELESLRRLCPKTCGACQAFYEKKLKFRGQCNAIHGQEQDFLGKCSAYVAQFYTLCSKVECGAKGGPISVVLQGKLDDVAAAGIHIEMNNLLLRGFPKLALLEHASGDPIINVNGYKAKVDFPYGESTLMWKDAVVEFFAKADVATPDKKNQWFSEFEIFAHGRQVATTAINPTNFAQMSIVVFDDNGKKQLLDDAGTYELADKSITVVVTKVADGGLSVSIRSTDFDVSITAEEANKFLPNREKARRYTHLDISLQKMTDSAAKAGILAELYGFVPMSANTARMMTSISAE